MLIPEALKKVLKMTSKAIHSTNVPVPKSITSSMNKRWIRDRAEEFFIPLISPFNFASLINRLRPSMTRMNRRGDKGHPCLMPLETLKKFEGVPFTSTTKFADDKQPIIQLTPRRGTPIWIRMSLRKDQLTLSKAFTKSRFQIRAHLFFALVICRISWVIPMGSTISYFWEIQTAPKKYGYPMLIYL